MDEETWGIECDAERLMWTLTRRSRPSMRKLRLCAAGTLRRFWGELSETARHAVDAVEALADRLTRRGEVDRRVRLFGADIDAEEQLRRRPTWYRVGLWEAAGTRRHQLSKVYGLLLYLRAEYDLTHSSVDPGQVSLIRDIFGNPFRTVAFDPGWRTDTAVSLARGMYAARDFAAMPILADALQDAGCENDDILAHCRDPQQVHVRGCWVVDLVLGKS